MGEDGVHLAMGRPYRQRVYKLELTEARDVCSMCDCARLAAHGLYEIAIHTLPFDEQPTAWSGSWESKPAPVFSTLQSFTVPRFVLREL